MTISTYIPPLAVSRIIGTYHFEDGGYVAIVGDGKCETCAMLDMAQEFINLKRAELAAQGIEAGTGETREAGLDAKHESPVAESDAPNPSEDSRRG